MNYFKILYYIFNFIKSNHKIIIMCINFIKFNYYYTILNKNNYNNK